MNLIEYEKATEICRSFAGARLLVVGDLMLDYWVWGTVSRISPEAPVPVVDIAHHSYTPGGAANVVANLKTLGAKVDLLGVVGADDIGRRLRVMLERQDIGISGLIVSEDYPTIMKTRIIANSQQVVRADLETRCAVKDHVWKKLLAWANNHRQDYDAVVISDYDKGLLWGDHIQDLIKIFRGVPVIAGPKPVDLKRFLGCELITLNAKEAKAAEDPKKVLAEKEEEYNKLFCNPYNAARYGYIDDVIEPRNTRFRVIRALQQLATKKVTNPAKKHGNIPL